MITNNHLFALAENSHRSFTKSNMQRKKETRF